MGKNRILYQEGQKIGNCIYLFEVEMGFCNDQYFRRGRFLCECGNEFHARISAIKNGNTSSCGCYQKKAASSIRKTHGGTNTPEYNAWLGMKNRCGNKNQPGYKDYGGRGIAVCEEWVNSFEKFMFDMGAKPSLDLSLDRVDNNKGYSKENCRWATHIEQRENRRISVSITYKGDTRPLLEWARIKNIPANTLRHRIKKGWDLDRAFMLPVRRLERFKSDYCQPCHFHKHIIPIRA